MSQWQTGISEMFAFGKRGVWGSHQMIVSILLVRDPVPSLPWREGRRRGGQGSERDFYGLRGSRRGS